MGKVKGRKKGREGKGKEERGGEGRGVGTLNQLKAVLLIKNSIIKARNQRTFNAINKLESMTYHKIKVLIICLKVFKS